MFSLHLQLDDPDSHLHTTVFVRFYYFTAFLSHGRWDLAPLDSTGMIRLVAGALEMFSMVLELLIDAVRS